MADVTGPTPTLPGQSTLPPTGAMCDEHPTETALRRVQGETDSFGAEYYDLCRACLENLKEQRELDRHGECEWCRKQATDLRPRRDSEEGNCGRVYDVCGDCVKRQEQMWREEAEEYDYYD